jgi:hypothetical protein
MLTVDKGRGRVGDRVDGAGGPQGPPELREPNRSGTEEAHNKTGTADDQGVDPRPPSKFFYKEPYRRDTESLRTQMWVYTGFIGTAVVAFIQLLQITILDLPLWVGLIAFAVAIPLLAGSLFCDNRKAHYPTNMETWWERAMNVVGMLATYVGITCLFWHFSFVAALIFFLASIVALFAASHVEVRLRKI